MLRQALGRQSRLLPAVVVLGLIGAALEGAGIGLVIPMLSIIVGHADTSQMGGLSAFFLHAGQGLDEGNGWLRSLPSYSS